MEGLLIAEQLKRLADGLPSGRSAWSFPDDRTAVLPLHGLGALVIRSSQGGPSLELTDSAPDPRRAPQTPFQRQLAARAGGDLLAAEQLALDRVVFLRFGASAGFVPEPSVSLVVELTGKNANLVLVDESGRIIGVERPVTSERNRYRELRSGVPYVPPPPYEKLDPRTAHPADLRAALQGRELGEVREVVDGIGPQLQAALTAAVRAGAGDQPTYVLTGAVLDRTLEALSELARNPSRSSSEYGSSPPAKEVRPQADEHRKVAQRAIASALKLARRRVADAERALEDGGETDRLRAEADLLLAATGSWRLHGSRATVTGLAGETVELEVDPRRDAAGNAQLRYDRARRREARRERARAQLPELRDEVSRLERLTASLDSMDRAALRAVAEELSGDVGRSRSVRGTASTARSEVGVRFRDPRGLEVVVGRNARENDAVTFKVARSRDVWLHAQGYRGAHVVIRSGGATVPFESILFAARLAAGFSEARDSSNVPVDYTERKNVWRVKGGAPGAVHYTQQKTVFVDPARDDAAAEGAVTPGRQT